MRFSKFLTAVAATTLASQGFAQISLNELYISHTSTDNMEFVELKGQGGMSLDGHMILVVEGDSTNTGILDDAIDLTGLTMPGDGYFVAGNTLVANLDLDVGAENVYENGTETFYLISTTDVPAVQALLGTNVDADLDLVTDIATMGTVTILDIVAMVDGGFGTTDFVYDGAPVNGPDGNFFPAGIYRGDDAPNGWCPNFLDFNLAGDRTPGAMNISCIASEPGTSYCFGTGCPCANDDAAAGCENTTGSGALLAGSGSDSVLADDAVVTLTGMAANQNGLIYSGPNQIDLPFGDGKRCIGGTVFRFPIMQADSSGMFAQGNLASTAGILSGDTVNFQGWYRDPGGPCGGAFNLTNGYTITFTP